MNPNSKENSVSIWDKILVDSVLTNLKLAPGTAEYKQYANAPSSQYTKDHNPSGIPLYQPSYPGVQKQMKCSCCNTIFESREDQVAHYSSEWHRINLKRSLDGLNCVTFEQFTKGNFSARKGRKQESSTEDEDEDEEKVKIQRKPRVFFLNADEEIISIYRTVLHHKKANLSSETELINRAHSIQHKLHWTILLIGGGHFAGGEFIGEKMQSKKTFHSYTSRAKQGGTQSSRDNKNATSQPKSAGANLRRKNEQSFNQNVKSLLEEWKSILDKSNLVFFKCPKSCHHLLFGGQNPPLSMNDERVRTIPFSTKKATLDEIWKVFDALSRIYTHGKASDFPPEAMNEKSPVKKEPSSPSKRINSREKSKKLSKGKLAAIDTQQEQSSSSEESLDRLTTSFQTITTDEVETFIPSIQEEIRDKKLERRKSESKGTAGNASNEAVDSKELKRVENYVYSACRTGNLEELKAFHQLFESRDYTDVSDMIPNYVVNTVLFTPGNYDWRSFKFGMQERTPLHVAAENGHKDVIWWMLENGCDPCSKNKFNETPYISTKMKEVRNHFRRYRATYPDNHDYEKADIPGPLTTEKEGQQKAKKEERKRLQKKAKKEKEKELIMERKKEEAIREEKRIKKEEIKRKEEEERQRFLQLSDREKRALAAERRIAAKASEASPKMDEPLLRCFQCAKDITNIVAYEYFDFKFCSSACVAEHRKKNKS